MFTPQPDGGPTALSVRDLRALSEQVQQESVLVHLCTEGAVECVNPLFRDFFIHQAEERLKHMEELSRLLRTAAGMSERSGVY